MAAHRYWRVSGLRPYDLGSVVELNEFWLLSGATRADAGVTLSSNIAPVSGALSSLQDNDLSTGVLLSDKTVLSWDFGVSTDVTNIRMGAGDSRGRFPAICYVEWSDDGVVWRELQLLRNWAGIKWPGARTLTESVLRIPPIEQRTIRMSFEPASWWLNEYGPSVSFSASVGASALTVNPISGARSVQFSGTGSLSAASVSSFAFSAGTDFTVQARVRPTASMSGVRSIVAFGGITEAVSVVSFRLDTSTGTLSLAVTGSTTRFVNSPAGAFGPLNVNRHVAASSENGTLRLFIDGVLVATDVGANTLGGYSNPSFTIGSYAVGGSNVFPGVIDEVGVDFKALYFGDFTPPAAIVPQPEWLIDAATCSPAFTRPVVVPTPGAMSSFAGVSLKALQARARPSYLFDPLARGRVRGNVLLFSGITNVPVSRRVSLVRERDMLIVMQQWSDRATGVYDFQYVEEGEAYTVIAHDYTHDKRAVIADGLTLANGKVELMP